MVLSQRKNSHSLIARKALTCGDSALNPGIEVVFMSGFERSSFNESHRLCICRLFMDGLCHFHLLTETCMSLCSSPGRSLLSRTFGCQEEAGNLIGTSVQHWHSQDASAALVYKRCSILIGNSRTRRPVA